MNDEELAWMAEFVRQACGEPKLEIRTPARTAISYGPRLNLRLWALGGYYRDRPTKDMDQKEETGPTGPSGFQEKPQWLDGY